MSPAPGRFRTKLPHLPEVGADESLFAPAYGPECSPGKCNADCCKGGVFADMEEKRRILEQIPLILSHMSPGQLRTPARWFENSEREDPDYPSGRTDGTEVHNGACVFLNDRRLCVLEVASRAARLPETLRPFFCRLYPITIESGTLTFEDPEIASRPECCGQSPGGRRPVEICADELGLVLDRSELDRIIAG